MKKNKVEKVMLAGGIIGMLSSNPQKALQNKFNEVNAEGWHVVQVIDDATGNLVVYLFRVLILIVTLLLWTPANGYYLVLEKDE